uniref:Uncharacterized protein n=1 Tax=Oryza punctata TaxID=4537 RepID=A0A0E0K3P1_ORYPU
MVWYYGGTKENGRGAGVPLGEREEGARWPGVPAVAARLWRHPGGGVPEAAPNGFLIKTTPSSTMGGGPCRRVDDD